MENAVADGTTRASSHRPRGRPRADSRLEEVIRIAAARFATLGYQATTLEDIGAELGMTRPALYYYAKSKEDLLVKCYDWTYDNFKERIGQALTGDTGRERLIQFFQVYADVVCGDVSRCFLSSETHYLSPENRRESHNRVRGINRMVRDLLAQGMRDGSIAACDPNYAVAMLFGAFNSLPNLTQRGSPSPSKLGEGLMKLILGGLAPRD